MANAAGPVGSSLDSLTNEYMTIAHNLANINTDGYKRKVTAFSLELERRMAGEENPEIKAGQITSASHLDFSPGALTATGRKLDVAIESKGYFVIETEDGPLYTRNGSFMLNDKGQLVDIEGRTVAGTAGPITVPSKISSEQLVIDPLGNISAGKFSLGQLKVVDFEDNENQLEPDGKNCLWAPEDLEPVAAEFPNIKQGYREKSNVNIAEEMMSLIAVSRMYETNMRVMKKQQENTKTILGVANS